MRDEINKIIKSKLYKDIKKDLLEQLKRNGIIGKYYIDLVNDYMDLWVTKSLLVEDIQTRGVQVSYDNGGGQSGKRKNDSIDQRLKVNAQMLKLLTEIGINPTQSYADEDDIL